MKILMISYAPLYAYILFSTHRYLKKENYKGSFSKKTKIIVLAWWSAVTMIMICKVEIKELWILKYIYLLYLTYGMIVDYYIKIIPDRVHLAGVVLGVGMIVNGEITTVNSILGMSILSIPLLIIALKTRGLGIGDVKLVASAGMVLGFNKIAISFSIGVFLAIIMIIVKKLRGIEVEDKIAFGPYLIIGITLLLL